MEKRNRVQLISILMSIYNEPENWLRQAIDSILTQTFSDFEFIIINDNPKRVLNNTILTEYQSKDKRIVIITNEINIGLTKSLNIGIKIAKGKYLARMDADDISMPNRLKVQFDFMENNKEIGVCGSYIKYFGQISKNDKSLYLDSQHIKSSLIYNNPIAHPTAFIRMHILKTHHIYFDENFTCTQDFKLWADLAPFTSFANIPRILLKYRIQEKQISQSSNTKQKELAAKVRILVIERYLGEYFQEFMNIKNKREQFNFIIERFKKSPEKSFLLLTIYLSLDKYKIIDFVKLLLHIHFSISSKNMIMIIKKNIRPSKYSDLI